MLAKKSLSALLSVLFFVSNCVFLHAAETNIWDARRKAVHEAQLALAAGPAAPSPFDFSRPTPSAFKKNPALPKQVQKNQLLKKAYESLPMNLGSIRGLAIPEAPNGKVLVHIQDVHMNAEAQTHIGDALAAFSRNLPVDVLALEGAHDVMDLKAFQEFPYPQSKDLSSARLIEKGVISGAIRGAWLSPEGLPLTVGVDDPQLHQANVDAYLASRAVKDQAEKSLAKKAASLQKEKTAIFNSSLADFDRDVQAYRSEAASLPKFVKILSARTDNLPAPLASFLSAVRLEDGLDFSRVERERKALLSHLIEKVTERETRTLVDLSVAYRAGHLSSGEFYAALESFCRKAGVNLNLFPEMSRYLRYVALSDSVDVTALLTGIEETETKIYARLANTSGEEALIRRDKKLFLTRRLLQFGLTSADWMALKELGLPEEKELLSFLDFYREAEKRDAAMASNILHWMEKDHHRVGVFVAGGFHSDGLEAELTRKGFSVIRYAPAVTKVENYSQEAALSVFAREKTPLEELFEGQALFLASHPFPRASASVAALDLAQAAARNEAAPFADLKKFIEKSIPGLTVKDVLKRGDGTLMMTAVGKTKEGEENPFFVVLDRNAKIITFEQEGPQASPRVFRQAFNYFKDSVRRFLSDEFLIERALLVMPLIETLALGLVRNHILDPFSPLSASAVILAGVGFALLHPSVYDRGEEDPGVGRFHAARFTVLTLMGGVFLTFLNAYGFGLALGIHVFYNGLILTARSLRNNHYASPFSPAGVLLKIRKTLSGREQLFSEKDDLPLPGPFLRGLIDFAASLPLAMINGKKDKPVYRFKGERTNYQRGIVKGTVLKWDPEAQRAKKKAQEDEKEEETILLEGEGRVVERILKAERVDEAKKITDEFSSFVEDLEEKSDEEGAALGEKFANLVLTPHGEKIQALIQEKNYSAAAALNQILDEFFPREEARDQEELADVRFFGERFIFHKLNKRKIRYIPASQIEDEVEKVGKKFDAHFQKIMNDGDVAEEQAAENFSLMFLMPFAENQIYPLIREKNYSAADAVMEVLNQFYTPEKIRGKGNYEETRRFTEEFVKTHLEEKVRFVEEKDVENEVAKVGREFDAYVQDIMKEGDIAEEQAAENFSLMFLMPFAENQIYPLIREKRYSAEDAVLEVLDKFYNPGKIAGKKNYEETRRFAQEFVENHLGNQGGSSVKKIVRKDPETPQEFLDQIAGDVVVVVRDPDPADMGRFVADPRVKAILVDGPYDTRHWASFLAPDRPVKVISKGVEKVIKDPVVVFGNIEAEKNVSLFEEAKTGAKISVNGVSRTVSLNEYEKGLERFEAYSEVLEAWEERPSITDDGVDIPVTGVLGYFPETREIEKLNKTTGGHVGLFRTEFLYAEKIPTEEHLVKGFMNTARNLNGVVTVRAIDRRPGDKNVAFKHNDPDEDAKGELKWLLETSVGQAAFRAQIRALLLAYAGLPEDKKNLRFMVPMVESAEQARRARAIFDEEVDHLQASGELPQGEPVRLPFGVMIETPLSEETLAEIFDMDQVEFASIGTRDLGDAYEIKDVLDEDYLEAIRRTLETAAQAKKSRGLPISLCGEHTANPDLIAFVTSIPSLKPVSPSWSVVNSSLSEIKTFIRDIDHQMLQGSKAGIHGEIDRALIERVVAEISAHKDKRVQSTAIFEEALSRALIKQGVAKAVKDDFDGSTNKAIRGVGLKADSEDETNRGVSAVPADEAGDMAYFFPLINAAARQGIASLKFRGINGNPALIQLERFEQGRVNRLVFSKDTQDRWRFAGVEGHRPGKQNRGAPIVGSEMGFGDRERDLVSLAMEGRQGLVDPKKKGTIIGMPAGERGAIKPLPDMYFVGVGASSDLNLDMEKIFDSVRSGQGSDVDLVKVARRAIQEARTVLGGKNPNVVVQLRKHHRHLINAIAEELELSEVEDAKEHQTDAYQTIQSRMNQAEYGRLDFFGATEREGALHVYEYDDWSWALSLHEEEGAHMLRLGIGGTPEAQMMSVLAKKLGGQFAGLFVPSKNNEKFSVWEKRSLKKTGVTDINTVLTQDDLVPGDPKDIAVPIAVLTDFAWGEGFAHETPGAVLEENGDVVVTVLWPVAGKIRAETIPYVTSLSVTLPRFKRDPDNEALALTVATGYLEFGAYQKARDLAAAWVEKFEEGEIGHTRWSALLEYAEGWLLLTEGNAKDPEKLVLDALARFTYSLGLLRKGELGDLANQIRVRPLIRQLYYYLRDTTIRDASKVKDPMERDALLHLAGNAYSSQALIYSDGGYETRLRDIGVRFHDSTQAYEEWRVEFIEEHGEAPNRREALKRALGFWWEYMETPAVANYLSKIEPDLAAESQTGQVDAERVPPLILYLFVTVFKRWSVVDQARAMRYLSQPGALRSFLTKISRKKSPRPDAAAETLEEMISKSQTEVSWQANALAKIRPDKVLLRPDLKTFLPRMASRPEASSVLFELILTSLGKADVMPALGNPDRRLPYLLEAAHHADLFFDFPVLFALKERDPETGKIKVYPDGYEDFGNPLPVLLELSLLYEELAAEEGSEVYLERSEFLTRVLTDSGEFIEYFSGLRDENDDPVFEADYVLTLDQVREEMLEEFLRHKERRENVDQLSSESAVIVVQHEKNEELIREALKFLEPAGKLTTVLIVEDIAEILEEVKQNVLRAGIKEENIITASDGMEGMIALKKEKIDFVISDLQMPAMDGFEMAQMAREEGIAAPILFHSSVDPNIPYIKRYHPAFQILKKSDKRPNNYDPMAVIRGVIEHWSAEARDALTLAGPLKTVLILHESESERKGIREAVEAAASEAGIKLDVREMDNPNLAYTLLSREKAELVFLGENAGLGAETLVNDIRIMASIKQPPFVFLPETIGEMGVHERDVDNVVQLLHKKEESRPEAVKNLVKGLIQQHREKFGDPSSSKKEEKKEEKSVSEFDGFFIPPGIDPAQPIETIVIASDMDGVFRGRSSEPMNPQIAEAVKRLLRTGKVKLSVLSGSPGGLLETDEWRQDNKPLGEALVEALGEDARDVSIFGSMGSHQFNPAGRTTEILDTFQPEEVFEGVKIILTAYFSQFLKGSNDAKRGPAGALLQELLKIKKPEGGFPELQTPLSLKEFKSIMEDVTGLFEPILLGIRENHLSDKARLLWRGTDIEFHAPTEEFTLDKIENLIKIEKSKVFAGLPEEQRRVFTGTRYAKISKTSKDVRTGEIFNEVKKPAEGQILFVTIGDGSVDFPMHAAHEEAHIGFHVGEEALMKMQTSPNVIYIHGSKGEDGSHIEGTIRLLNNLAEGLEKNLPYNQYRLYDENISDSSAWALMSLRELSSGEEEEEEEEETTAPSESSDKREIKDSLKSHMGGFFYHKTFLGALILMMREGENSLKADSAFGTNLTMTLAQGGKFENTPEEWVLGTPRIKLEFDQEKLEERGFTFKDFGNTIIFSESPTPLSALTPASKKEVAAWLLPYTSSEAPENQKITRSQLASLLGISESSLDEDNGGNPLSITWTAYASIIWMAAALLAWENSSLSIVLFAGFLAGLSFVIALTLSLAGASTSVYPLLHEFRNFPEPAQVNRVVENKGGRITGVNNDVLSGLPQEIQRFVLFRETLFLQRWGLAGDILSHLIVDQFVFAWFVSAWLAKGILSFSYSASPYKKQALNQINENLDATDSYLGVERAVIRFADVSKIKDLASEADFLRGKRGTRVMVVEDENDALLFEEKYPDIHFVSDSLQGVEKLQDLLIRGEISQLELSISSDLKNKLGDSYLAAFLRELEETGALNNRSINVEAYLTSRVFSGFLLKTISLSDFIQPLQDRLNAARLALKQA